MFGSSAGALIGLELVARHPELVRTLVAHEPPAHYLVSDEELSHLGPLEVYRREGACSPETVRGPERDKLPGSRSKRCPPRGGYEPPNSDIYIQRILQPLSLFLYFTE